MGLVVSCPAELPPASPATESFDSLGLPSPLLAAVGRLGFSVPTAIQAAAIPALLDGRDITGVAQTGTGKTAAFGLPLLARIDPADRHVQALVLAPTRELAVQVADAIAEFARELPGVGVTAVYGGAPMGRQLSALRGGAQVVVGTPGRIIDHLERGSLSLDRLRFAVLDEADEMLHMGFVEDVDRILSQAPVTRQTALFSATMPAAIRSVAERHLRKPLDVSVAASATPVDAIEQHYVVLPFRQKVDALVRLLAVSDGGAGAADAAVVFVRTRSACEEVGAELLARGVSAAVISGDVAQRERERTIARLRSRQVDVLVATDVAARGLDVERIGLVVNFDAPSDPETYVHRVGRTGRAGRAGRALLFLTPREMPRLRAIERATGQRLTQITPPTAAEVTAHRAAAQLAVAVTRQGVGRLDACRQALVEAAEGAGLSVTDLAAALLAVVVGDDGTVPVEEPPAPHRERPARAARRGDAAQHGDDARHDDHTDRGDRPARAPRQGRGPTGGARDTGRRGDLPATRYVVQVGRRHGVRPAGIVGAITGEGGLHGSDLGRIDIFDAYSVVEITRPVRPDALARIRRATVSGQQLRIARDRSDGKGGPSRHRTPAQNREGWGSGAGTRPRRGKLPAGKRDSALPGTPRTS